MAIFILIGRHKLLNLIFIKFYGHKKALQKAGKRLENLKIKMFPLMIFCIASELQKKRHLE